MILDSSEQHVVTRGTSQITVLVLGGMSSLDGLIASNEAQTQEAALLLAVRSSSSRGPPFLKTAQSTWSIRLNLEH